MNIAATRRTSVLFRGLLLAAAGLLSVNALAQDEETAAAEAVAEEDAKELGKVIITGSRIARTQAEGPSAVVIIDREQIEREGFTTVQDALKSLSQANGVVQNELFTGGFTNNANSIDIRGLGPGRLLLLVDGRRAADYPLPYNGQSNIVNIAALPLVAVDRIEILSGGASAIYGSDAVAGVVNIILRRDLGNSIDMNVRVGDTKDGGFETTRFQAVGGFLGRKWNITYAAEFLERDPLFANQRDFMDSNDDNPNPSGRVNSFNVIEVNLFSGFLNANGFPQEEFVDPGPTACDAFSNQEYSTREGRGSYCGNKTTNAETTVINGRDQFNFYTAASLELGDRHEVYGSFNYFEVDADIDSGFRFYQRQVYDPASPDPWINAAFPTVPGGYSLTQRIFTNEEIGGPNLWTYEEEVIDFSGGIRGELFSPLWSYDLIYSRSDYNLDRDRRLIVNDLAAAYFYDDLGVGDPLGQGLPIATLDRTAFYNPVTPAIWDSLTEVSEDAATSTSETITAVIRGDLFDLPAGTVSMAAVIESGKQEYGIFLDPLLEQGGYYFGLRATGGGGERDRDAIGVEFQIPVTSKFNISAAARQDEYDVDGNTADKLTFNLGAEYRPTSKLLLRGTRSTSFRAPDMHNLFAAPSGFFTNVDDLYLCRRDEPTVPLDACTFADDNIEGARQGNPFLEEEEGDSVTLGFVWSPTDNLSLSADFYDIDLKNAVVDNPLARILELEADCRLGVKDISSGECVDAIRRVDRNPADNSLNSERINIIETGPANASVVAVQGVDATLQYNIQADSGWRYGFDLGWSHSLSYDFAVFPEDEVNDIRTTGTRDWRSRVRGSVSMGYKDFSATLFGERFGSALSDENIATGVGRSLPSITNFNLTGSYGFLDGKASVSIIVNNLFDQTPQNDSTNTGYPYFDIFSYGQFVIGRTIYGQFRYRFDY